MNRKNTKYNKYDKGRFVKPISRKKKSAENLEYQQKLASTRARVTQWIDSLPDREVREGIVTNDEWSTTEEKTSEEEDQSLSVKTIEVGDQTANKTKVLLTTTTICEDDTLVSLETTGATRWCI